MLPIFEIATSIGYIITSTLFMEQLFKLLSKIKLAGLVKIYTEYKLKRKRLLNELDRETFDNLKIETKELKATNQYLLNEIRRSSKVIGVLDKLRDKYNFKRVATLMFSNGTVTLSGSGLFYYSITEEVHSYRVSPIKELYQRTPLTPLFPLVSECLEKPIWDSQVENDIDEVNRLLNLHSTERMLVTQITLEDNIIGFLIATFGEFTTYPDTSDMHEVITEKEAEADILLTKFMIETAHLKPE